MSWFARVSDIGSLVRERATSTIEQARTQLAQTNFPTIVLPTDSAERLQHFGSRLTAILGPDDDNFDDHFHTEKLDTTNSQVNTAADTSIGAAHLAELDDDETAESELLIPMNTTAAAAAAHNEQRITPIRDIAMTLDLPSLVVTSHNTDDSDRKPLIAAAASNSSRSVLSRPSERLSAFDPRHHDQHNGNAHKQQVQAQQEKIFAAQDEMLSDMRETIRRLGGLSSDINSEVSEHNEMLAEVAEQIDENEDLLQRNTKRIQELINAAPPNHLYIIAVLTTIFIVLLLYLIYS